MQLFLLCICIQCIVCIYLSQPPFMLIHATDSSIALWPINLLSFIQFIHSMSPFQSCLLCIPFCTRCSVCVEPANCNYSEFASLFMQIYSNFSFKLQSSDSRAIEVCSLDCSYDIYVEPNF